MLHTILLILLVWFLGSIPLGILVGRKLAAGNRLRRSTLHTASNPLNAQPPGPLGEVQGVYAFHSNPDDSAGDNHRS